jgi:ubiquinone/menaquinone biosynthesis C-methylase UbiE
VKDYRAETERIQDEYRRRAREIAPDRYSMAQPDSVLRHAGVIRLSAALLKTASLFPPDGKDILDVGCGRGDWLLEMTRWGAAPERLCGIDLNYDRVMEAHKRMPAADIRAGDASTLPWQDGSFDLVTQFTVFSSILDAGLRRDLAADMLRVLRPGGAILWYDIRRNNPWNHNVIGLDRKAVSALFPECRIEWRTATLAPPLSRLAVSISWYLAALLEALPPLRSHAVALIRKPGLA